jgi:hypothetical protein
MSLLEKVGVGVVGGWWMSVADGNVEKGWCTEKRFKEGEEGFELTGRRMGSCD